VYTYALLFLLNRRNVPVLIFPVLCKNSTALTGVVVNLIPERSSHRIAVPLHTWLPKLSMIKY
jgi:hypothetical protein